MVRHVGSLSAIVVLLASCAAPPPPSPPPPQTVPAQQARVLAEAATLRRDLQQAVPQGHACRPDEHAGWIKPVRAALAAAGVGIDHPQLVLAVDRNPHRQALCLLLAQPDAAWLAIGGGKVSTGQAGRRGYFITPTGVFRHTTAIIDYRAEGTFNENHIRGLGRKGMRVWDFGWQPAQRGWTPDPEPAEIRLLVHATDPDVLEPRLGEPASQGCVRISAAMNRFLDQYGVLDEDYARAAPFEPRIAAVLAPDRRPTPLAGDLLVVIDSSGTP